jgi:hypothetical protein
MSEEKHLKVNLDVNVQINLKINKKDGDKNKLYNIINSDQGKLPELKNNSKGAKNR